MQAFVQQKRICLQCRRCRRPGFDPWVKKIPWRRKWQPTSALMPGKSQGQRSLVGIGLWGRKESDTTEATEHACTHICTSPAPKWNASDLSCKCKSNKHTSKHKFILLKKGKRKIRRLFWWRVGEETIAPRVRMEVVSEGETHPRTMRTRRLRNKTRGGLLVKPERFGVMDITQIKEKAWPRN